MIRDFLKLAFSKGAQLLGNPPQTFVCLAYHRVTSTHTDCHFNPHFIPLSTLRDHLQYINRACNVLPLDEIMHRLTIGARLYRWPTALCFHGGYPEHLSSVAPICSHDRIPAIFFVPLPNAETGIRPWYDTLNHLLPHSSHAQKEIVNFLSKHSGSTLANSPPDLQEIQRLVAHLRSDAKSAFAALTAELAKDELDKSSQAVLSIDQLLALRATGMLIGAQIPPEAYLATTTALEIRRLLEQSASILNRIDPNLPFIVAYAPTLTIQHIGDSLHSIFRELGVLCALTNLRGPNVASTDPYLLRTITPPNERSASLAQRLSSAFISAHWIRH